MELLSYTYLIIEIFLLGLSIFFFIKTRFLYGFIGFISIFFYPFLYEFYLFLQYKMLFLCQKSPYKIIGKKVSVRKSNIVYDPRYNMKLCGIEKNHPFDSCKYERVLMFLKKNHNLHFQLSKGPESKF